MDTLHRQYDMSLHSPDCNLKDLIQFTLQLCGLHKEEQISLETIKKYQLEKE